MSIETLMDHEYVTVENLIGWLKAVEDHYDLDGGLGSSWGGMIESHGGRAGGVRRFTDQTQR
jgi:hypothetical protein